MRVCIRAWTKVLRIAGLVRAGDECMILDCRGFQDPKKGTRWHLGMHATNLYNIVHHKDCGPCLRGVRNLVEQWWNSDATSNLVIVAYCRKGAHRSVAMAVLIHHLLGQFEPKYSLLPIRHLSAEAGVRWSDYCGECGRCREFSFLRTEFRITQKILSCASRYMNPCALLCFWNTKYSSVRKNSRDLCAKENNQYNYFLYFSLAGCRR